MRILNLICSHYFLAVAITFSLSTTASAIEKNPGKDPSFTEALNLFNQKNFAAARDRLLKLTKKEPKRALYWLNLGAAQYMLKNYRAAELAYRRTIEIGGPMTNPAKWYLAKALRDQGKTADALKTFDDLLASPDLTANLRDQAEYDREAMAPPSENDPSQKEALDAYKSGSFKESLNIIERIRQPDDNVLLLKSLALEKLDRPKEAEVILKKLTTPEARDLANALDRQLASDRRLWAYIDLSAGYDNNIYLDGSSDNNRSSSLSKNYWSIGGKPYSSGAFGAILSYQGSWEEVFQAKDLQVVTNEILLSGTYDVNAYHVQLGPYFEKAMWAGSNAMTSYGLRGRAREVWEAFEAGTEFDFSQHKEDQAQYSYLAGSSSSIRLFGAWTSAPIYAQLYLDYGQNQSGDLNYSDGSVLPLAQKYYGAGTKVIWKANTNWVLTSQASYLIHSFDKHASPGNKERSDRETLASFRITRYWTADVSTYLILNSISNASTLGRADVADKNYNDVNSLVGVLWDIL